MSILDTSSAQPDPIINLSLGGLLFLARVPLKINDKLDLVISLPDHAIPIKARASVKGVQTLEGDDRYRIDAAFSGMSPQGIATLRSLEHSVLPKQQQMLNELMATLAPPEDLAAEFRDMVARSVNMEPVPAGKQEGAEPDRPEALEAVDRLLSDALSRQPPPAGSSGGQEGKGVALIDADAGILHTEPLGGEGGRANVERRMSRFLQIFFAKDAPFCAYQLTDDSMTSVRKPSFAPGAVVVFVHNRKPRAGDFALVETEEGRTFRQVFFEDEAVRLRPLNPRYPETFVRRSEIKSMSRIAGHYEPM